MSAAQVGFCSVIDAALDHKVDLFLLAGDLFDHNRVEPPCLEFVSEQTGPTQLSRRYDYRQP